MTLDGTLSRVLPPGTPGQGTYEKWPAEMRAMGRRPEEGIPSLKEVLTGTQIRIRTLHSAGKEFTRPRTAPAFLCGIRAVDPAVLFRCVSGRLSCPNSEGGPYGRIAGGFKDNFMVRDRYPVLPRAATHRAICYQPTALCIASAAACVHGVCVLGTTRVLSSLAGPRICWGERACPPRGGFDRGAPRTGNRAPVPPSGQLTCCCSCPMPSITTTLSCCSSELSGYSRIFSIIPCPRATSSGSTP